MQRIISLFVAAVALTACSDTREVLGLNKPAPDEFAVVDRAPLTVPPDFALRPPQPGAARPQEVAPSTQAAAAVLGEMPAAPSAGNLEHQLLASAGADKAAPDIRKIVDDEAAAAAAAKSRHLADDLLWWRKPQDESAVVDPAGEAARLRDNQAKDKPANSGATPVIKKQKSGLLGQ